MQFVLYTNKPYFFKTDLRIEDVKIDFSVSKPSIVDEEQPPGNVITFATSRGLLFIRNFRETYLDGNNKRFVRFSKSEYC